LAEGVTRVYDASGQILGRLASLIAKELMAGQKNGRDDRAVVINAEKAIVSGRPSSVFKRYRAKYELNHPRKGPFFPRMPDKILKRTVRGMLPYQAKTRGRDALRNLRVWIGTRQEFSDGLPDGHVDGDLSSIAGEIPERHVTLNEISHNLGAPVDRWATIGGGA